MMRNSLKLIFVCIIVTACDKGTHMPDPVSEDQTPQVQPSQDQSSGNPQAQSPTPSGPTFDDDIKPIFTKYCSSCHKPGSGIPNWNNYNEAHAKKDRIFDRTIVQKTMPPPGAPKLQPAELTKLAQWIKSNAPEKSQVTVTPDPATPKVVVAAPKASAALTNAQDIAKEIRPTAPTASFYCEQVERQSNKNIRSNRSLAITTSTDIKNLKLEFSKLTFNSDENISTVENITLYKPNALGAEVCGTYVNDLKNCDVINEIKNPYNAHFDVLCDLENPIHFEFYLVGGYAVAKCESKNLNIYTQFRSCKSR